MPHRLPGRLANAALLALGLLLLPAHAQAPTAARPAVAAPSEPALAPYREPQVGRYGDSTAMTLLRTVLSLGLVVGLIAGVGWLARTRTGLAASPAGYRLRMLENMALGPNRTLYLVAVGRQVLLLGGGPNGVATLATFGADDLGYDPDALQATPVDSFLARLQAFRGADSAVVPIAKAR